MIELNRICKTFRVAQRSAGMREAAKALFRRTYSEIHALQDVSFCIGDGEMVGYIGPNGAGKSSTIKVMSGILTPDSGSCVIDGCVPWRDRQAHAANIGVVFGQRSQLWWDVPVIDSFELIRDIYRVDEGLYRQSLDELTELLDLSSILRTPTRQLSLGQRMRCEIAASLIHRPRILFLDEPTIGLDAVSKLAVRDFIRRINRERGTTVILTTHDMQDIEALTERIILIGRGRILLDGTLDALKARHSTLRQITVAFTAGTPSPADRPLPAGFSLISASEDRVTVAIDTEIVSVSDAIEGLTRGVDVRDLSVAGQSTDELVVSLYEEFRI
ncbi:MAG: ATP-binding cassette domain-containing protein [Clostridia bacterium]|nr:ATP-binding cassette domain-containing protein [Clostridia bacterium]